MISLRVSAIKLAKTNQTCLPIGRQVEKPRVPKLRDSEVGENKQLLIAIVVQRFFYSIGM